MLLDNLVETRAHTEKEHSPITLKRMVMQMKIEHVCLVASGDVRVMGIIKYINIEIKSRVKPEPINPIDEGILHQ